MLYAQTVAFRRVTVHVFSPWHREHVRTLGRLIAHSIYCVVALPRGVAAGSLLSKGGDHTIAGTTAEIQSAGQSGAANSVAALLRFVISARVGIREVPRTAMRDAVQGESTPYHTRQRGRAKRISRND